MIDARPESGRLPPRRYAGVRRMSPELYQTQDDAETFEGLPEGMTHWDVFALLDRAATPMGFSRVEIDTLRVLFKFSQPQDWRPGSRPVVWPSNETLMIELGLSRTALKYRLRCVASKGLIAFRDSPTGKRFGHRDHQGALILTACFGIDLSPTARRLEECERASARHEMERGLRRELRRRRTIAVKAVRQALEAVWEFDLEVDTCPFEDGLAGLPEVSDPWTPLGVLSACVMAAEALRARAEAEVKAALDAASASSRLGQSVNRGVVHPEDLDPVGSPIGPDIQITTDLIIDKSNYRNAALRSERRPAGSPSPSPDPSRRGIADGVAGKGDGNSGRHGHGVDYISRSMALKLMPETMRAFMVEAGVEPRGASWVNLVEVAYWHLSDIGISESAWQQACAAMGRNGAAVAVFIIAAKRDEIRKPDRYLRSMAYRAEAGDLQLHRSAWGILRGGAAEHGHA